MSSNRQLSLITLLMIASLISIGVLFLRKSFSFNCQQTDKTVCTFLKNYKQMSSKPMKGSYVVTNRNDNTTYKVLWETYKENRIISALRENEPILDVVIFDNYLYLKDFMDNKWWKQKLSDTPNTDSYLPFDPYQFFKELDPILYDSQTIYKNMGEIPCSGKQCVRYLVTSPKQSADLQRFVYITSDSQIAAVYDANTSSSHETELSQAKSTISEPSQTKFPRKDQNIFLDYLTRREQQREKQLEYLKEFQIEREKAEEITNDLPHYIEETPTASQSAN